MRLKFLQTPMLLLALALSQWLVVGHALQHPALSDEQTCVICLHAQGLDSAAVMPALPALPVLTMQETLAFAPVQGHRLARAQRVSIRGPPRFLC